MKRYLLTLSLLAISAGLFAQQAYRTSDRYRDDDDRSYRQYDQFDDRDDDRFFDRGDRTRIQLALILDTSGSMDDLIDQARGQMWSMVHEIMYGSDGDYRNQPVLEIALYEYGSSRLSRRDDFIALHVPFTTDLDWVADELFTLRTAGRAEYHGTAVARAVQELDWSRDPRDLKLIFIAGNEDFDQGPVDFRRAMAMAASKDISVNTIYCGDYDRGRRLGWDEGAYFGGGDYLAIGTYQRSNYYDPGFRNQMLSLNQAYNATFIPYGRYGTNRYQRLCRIDDYAYGYGQTVIVNRTLVKVSPGYYCADWDLVEAYRLGLIDLRTFPVSDLPPNMRRMTFAQRQAYLVRMQNERDRLRGQIRTVATPRRATPPPPGSTGPAISQGSRPSGSSQPRRATSPRTLDRAVTQSVRQHQARQAEGRSPRRPANMPSVDRNSGSSSVSSGRSSSSQSGRQSTVSPSRRPSTVQSSSRSERSSSSRENSSGYSRPSSSASQSGRSSSRSSSQVRSSSPQRTERSVSPSRSSSQSRSRASSQSQSSAPSRSARPATQGSSRASSSTPARSSSRASSSSSRPSTESRSSRASSSSSSRSSASRTESSTPARSSSRASSSSSRPSTESRSNRASSSSSSRSSASRTESGSSESRSSRAPSSRRP